MHQRKTLKDQSQQQQPKKASRTWKFYNSASEIFYGSKNPLCKAVSHVPSFIFDKASAAAQPPFSRFSSLPSRLEKESQIDRSRIEVGISNWHDLRWFFKANPSITSASFWLEDIIVHMVPIDCAVYDLFYGPETWLQRSFCYFCCDSLTTSTSDDHTDKDDSTTSKQRKSNFLNPKGFPKKGP